MTLKQDAQTIIRNAIDSALPDNAVKQALKNMPEVRGNLYVVAFGKAAWQMSHAAYEVLKDTITKGICITKYYHSRGDIPHFEIYEAGHPIMDENSVHATQRAVETVDHLCEDDMVIVLISGGGSALFEDPLIPLSQLQDITSQMLACGADITEMNTIRKRLSKVKGGRFAEIISPAHVFAVVLSDIISDPLDMIASGPCYPDASSSQDALRIVDKYHLDISDEVRDLLNRETSHELFNVETHVSGSVRQLCASAGETAVSLGYKPVVLTSSLNCEAKEAGTFLACIAKDHAHDHKNIAYICGGETVVHVTGKGKGGRNQELALSAAAGIAGLDNVCIFSFGSDGTDGPTDAAGGYVDGNTVSILKEKGISIDAVLSDNDAYHALQKCDGLIITGPTGTNVNDLSVVLIHK